DALPIINFKGECLVAHNMSPEEVEANKVYLEMGLSEEEFQKIKSILGRLPNYTETGIFSVMWSEHCSYKTSKPLLGRFPTKGKQVLVGPGEGAGVVDIGDNQAVVFKMESHNSPSRINPFEGAATGVGGILRDVFSMGARPIAAMNSLRFGPLGNAMVVGLIDHSDVQKGIASGVGNSVIYAGAPTGRDGIHGATHSSDDAISEDAKPAAGNPHLEKRLIDACLEAINSENLV